MKHTTRKLRKLQAVLRTVPITAALLFCTACSHQSLPEGTAPETKEIYSSQDATQEITPVPTPTPDPKEETKNNDPESTEESSSEPETEPAESPTPTALPLLPEEYGLFGEQAYAYLKEISSSYPYRTCGSDQEKAAGEWIRGKLESFGYTVTKQSFKLVDQNGDGRADDSIGPDQYAEYPILGTSQNYFVKKPGNTSKTLVICAHYDCVDTTGCEDNGSGVAVVLELAKRMYAAAPLDYTLLFAFYGSEEPGMMGSVHHVRTLMGSGEWENISGVINVDCVAAGDQLYIHGGMPEADGSISRYGLASLALKLSDADGLGMTTHPETKKIPAKTRVYASDQFHFAVNGKPYIYLEANLYSDNQPDGYAQWYQTADERVPGGQFMHTEYDNFETIETLFPGRIRDHLRRYEILLNLLLPNITDGVLNA